MSSYFDPKVFKEAETLDALYDFLRQQFSHPLPQTIPHPLVSCTINGSDPFTAATVLYLSNLLAGAIVGEINDDGPHSMRLHERLLPMQRRPVTYQAVTVKLHTIAMQLLRA
jgi:hypothetical protein